MKIGFIGLGNVGRKLAGSLLRNGFDLMVRDLDESLSESFASKGAKVAKSPKELTQKTDLVITCLPSPTVCSKVMESEEGVIDGLSKNKIWLEMSTTDESEVKRIGELVKSKGAIPLDGPVSGGCHRAATGNISIFVGGKREAFEKILPALTIMGKKILHTGDLVKISSGNSFVHETESQVILNGSYNINFTMDLVVKDMSLFNNLSKKSGVQLEISPIVLNIFREGKKKYGPRAWSSMIVKRLEDAYNTNLRADGFPAELIDSEPETKGAEI